MNTQTNSTDFLRSSVRASSLAIGFIAFSALWPGLEARGQADRVRAFNVPSEVSVRLRPLKGLISVSGQNLALYSTGLKANLFQAEGLRHLQLRFETLAGEPAWSVLDRNSGKSLARIQGRFAELRGDDLRVDLRPSPSHIRLVATKANSQFDLQLVGLVPIDDYVHGVVSAEVPRDWPVEALKAQAVAARSFALAKIRERSGKSRDWLLEATIMDQVFDHARKHDLAMDAVLATRGEVLAGAHGVATAHYHADCGGHTDEPSDVWDGGEAIGTSKDQCSNRNSSRWRMVASLEDLAQKLKVKGKIPFTASIAGMSVVDRTQGGRARGVRLVSSRGEVSRVTGEELRAVLGYMNLKSTKFEIKIFGDQAEFVGRGFGHGAGLCQWGARALAKNGADYRSILRHYYPKLELKSLAQSTSDLLAQLSP